MEEQTLEKRVIDWNLVVSKLKKYGKSDNSIAEALPKMKRIIELCNQENAILLAHYYQIPELQYIADVTGDSLKLCVEAQKVKSKYIVFCGVHFMAESAHLMNPERTVLLPDTKASCSIAEGINADMIKHIKKNLPRAAVLAYINTTAETKAEVDSIYTSSSAVKVFENIPNQEVVLLPDPNLAANLIEKTKDRVNKKVYYYKRYEKENKTIVIQDVLNNSEIKLSNYQGKEPLRPTGACYVHEILSQTPGYIDYMKKKHNADLVIGHFEVSPELIKQGYISTENIGSTSDLLKYIEKSKAKRVLMLTECNFGATIKEQFPNVEIITPCIFCDYMKKISLDSVIESLEQKKHAITIPEPTFTNARNAIYRMFELAQ